MEAGLRSAEARQKQLRGTPRAHSCGRAADRVDWLCVGSPPIVLPGCPRWQRAAPRLQLQCELQTRGASRAVAVDGARTRPSGAVASVVGGVGGWRRMSGGWPLFAVEGSSASEQRVTGERPPSSCHAPSASQLATTGPASQWQWQQRRHAAPAGPACAVGDQAGADQVFELE